MSTSKAFDDSQHEIGGLTIDSAADQVSFYGSLDIPADRTGLALATTLAASVNTVLAELTARAKAGTLPDRLSLRKPTPGANPFG